MITFLEFLDIEQRCDNEVRKTLNLLCTKHPHYKNDKTIKTILEQSDNPIKQSDLLEIQRAGASCIAKLALDSSKMTHERRLLAIAEQSTVHALNALLAPLIEEKQRVRLTKDSH